eukprot:289278_1
MSTESDTDWDNSIYLQDYVVLAYSYLTAVIVASTTGILLWKLYQNANKTDKHSSFMDDDKTQTHTFHASGDEESHTSYYNCFCDLISSVQCIIHLIFINSGFTEWIIVIN